MDFVHEMGNGKNQHGQQGFAPHQAGADLLFLLGRNGHDGADEALPDLLFLLGRNGHDGADEALPDLLFLLGRNGHDGADEALPDPLLLAPDPVSLARCMLDTTAQTKPCLTHCSWPQTPLVWLAACWTRRRRRSLA